MMLSDSRIDSDRRAYIADQMRFFGTQPDTDGVATIVSLIPDCDVCKFEDKIYGVKAVADAKTDTGQWGNVCETHLRLCCIGLGYGLGQMFVLATPRPKSPKPGTVGAMLEAINPDSIGAGYPEEG